MVFKLALILFAAVVASASFLEGQQIGKQEEKSLESFSNLSQREGIQGNICRKLLSMK